MVRSSESVPSSHATQRIYSLSISTTGTSQLYLSKQSAVSILIVSLALGDTKYKRAYKAISIQWMFCHTAVKSHQLNAEKICHN